MAQFQVGELIHHKRYDYRGVVVAIDPNCNASDTWYLRNLTQPDRDQPWYHVLVHGGRETYVAEENLEPDCCPSPVRHPLVNRVFTMFLKGRYHRFSPN
jgi:heat shock protein HspQ